ncbi:unnamed protein product [Gadus morhua 'NCC']
MFQLHREELFLLLKSQPPPPPSLKSHAYGRWRSWHRTRGVDSCKEGQRIATPQQAISCSFIRLEHRSQVLQIQLMASADHLEEDK